jgi:D-3-phosphoglycerate dehydrogenase / 2-oxoglutarate reductase
MLIIIVTLYTFDPNYASFDRMKSYQVFRTHLSPYQNKNFLLQEKALIETFDGLEYRSVEDLGDRDIILITNTHTQLKKLPLSVIKKTKLIIHPNSGYDHFHDEHELWRDIPLIVGHTIRAQAVAEYSLRSLFEGMIDFPQHISWNQQRKWDRPLLKDLSVWIFGYGHIGKIIADTLATLGMDITVIDPFIESCPHRWFRHWDEGKIKSARVIISAMSLNPTSHHLFGESFFQNLGEAVLFINGARGKLVQENFLRSYLQSHPRSFAFLDVFEQEPFGDEWHGFPQVWKTSHIAGVDKDLDSKILEFEWNVLANFLQSSPQEFTKMYAKELLQNKWLKGVLI